MINTEFTILVNSEEEGRVQGWWDCKQREGLNYIYIFISIIDLSIFIIIIIIICKYIYVCASLVYQSYFYKKGCGINIAKS